MQRSGVIFFLCKRAMLLTLYILFFVPLLEQFCCVIDGLCLVPITKYYSNFKTILSILGKLLGFFIDLSIELHIKSTFFLSIKKFMDSILT